MKIIDYVKTLLKDSIILLSYDSNSNLTISIEIIVLEKEQRLILK